MNLFFTVDTGVSVSLLLTPPVSTQTPQCDIQLINYIIDNNNNNTLLMGLMIYFVFSAEIKYLHFAFQLQDLFHNVTMYLKTSTASKKLLQKN